jgi:hypothetical protein
MRMRAVMMLMPPMPMCFVFNVLIAFVSALSVDGSSATADESQQHD